MRELQGMELVLVGTALIDLTLEKSLLTKLPNSDSAKVRKMFRSGPLSTTGALINRASQLGILSPESRSQIDLIRKVRNKFAHTFEPITFDDPLVAKHVDEMTIAFGGDLKFGVAVGKVVRSSVETLVDQITIDDQALDTADALIVVDGNGYIGYAAPHLRRSDQPTREEIFRHQVMVGALICATPALNEWYGTKPTT